MQLRLASLRSFRPMIPLPLPRVRLADCVWLPRLIAKIRGLERGALPAEYVARFCDHDSVDEHFLRYFEISKDEMVEAVTRLGSDEAIAHWFRARPGLSTARIERWNEFAEDLGKPGFPMAARLVEVRPKMYAHLGAASIHSIFDLLEADETSATSQPPTARSTR
jgi:Domain of unknown function (DUF5069)